MAMTYATAAQTVRLQAVADFIEGGEIELREGSTVIASWTISGTLTASGNTLTITNTETNNTVAAIASTTTAADNIRIATSGDADAITGITVGVGTGEVQFDSLDITIGQDVILSNIVITHN